MAFFEQTYVCHTCKEVKKIRVQVNKPREYVKGLPRRKYCPDCGRKGRNLK